MLITSKDNAQVKLAVRLRDSARARREQGLFFLEGWRLCVDALESGFVPEMLFTTAAAQVKYPVAHENVTLISEAVAGKLADTVCSQGVFGVFRAPVGAIAPDRPQRKIIALENLQDPANLGAIARTAEALGLDGLVVSGGCDVHHPKALRASMGALLRLDVTQVDDLPAWLNACELPSFAAVPGNLNGGQLSSLDGGRLRAAAPTPLPRCDFSGGAVVAIGNEGNGLSEETIAACGQRLTIPMAGKSESLNAAAAAAIIIWELCQLTIDS